MKEHGRALKKTVGFIFAYVGVSGVVLLYTIFGAAIFQVRIISLISQYVPHKKRPQIFSKRKFISYCQIWPQPTVQLRPVMWI
jgi:hypothetical protein